MVGLNFNVMLLVSLVALICMLGCSEEPNSNLASQEVGDVSTPIPTFTISSNLSETPESTLSQAQPPVLTPTSVISKSEPVPETPVKLDTIEASGIFKLWDEALADPYSYSSEMEIDIVATIQGNQEVLKIKVAGVSEGANQDVTAVINDTHEMGLLKKGERSFLKERGISDAGREIPDGPTLLNAGELVVEVRKHIDDFSVVGYDTMG